VKETTNLDADERCVPSTCIYVWENCAF